MPARFPARCCTPASNYGGAVVWYPKWIPGVHAPGGQCRYRGLRFETTKGESIRGAAMTRNSANFTSRYRRESIVSPRISIISATSERELVRVDSSVTRSSA
jgi:hypothetical protein